MSVQTCRAAALVLAAAIAFAGPSAMAGAVDASRVEIIDTDHHAPDLPPALDAFLDIVSGIMDDVSREPAWRNPHASPRPSPDRDFVFPPTEEKQRSV